MVASVFAFTSNRGPNAKGIFHRPGGTGAIAALVLMVVASAATAFAGRVHLEAWYADALAAELGARTEVRMRNGTRCDVLADRHSIEVEFAGKWCEAIGQALCYSSQTGKAGAVAVILESSSDEKFLTRLREVIAWHRLPIAVIVMKPLGKSGLEFEFPAELSTRRARR